MNNYWLDKKKSKSDIRTSYMGLLDAEAELIAFEIPEIPEININLDIPNMIVVGEIHLPPLIFVCIDLATDI